MFVILVNYLKPLEDIDRHLAEHRSFLDECYQHEYFVASGPRIPRTGGVLISTLKDRALLESILERDPFKIQGLASYEIIQFTAVKGLPMFKE